MCKLTLKLLLSEKEAEDEASGLIPNPIFDGKW